MNEREIARRWAMAWYGVWHKYHFMESEMWLPWQRNRRKIAKIQKCRATHRINLAVQRCQRAGLRV